MIAVFFFTDRNKRWIISCVLDVIPFVLDASLHRLSRKLLYRQQQYTPLRFQYIFLCHHKAEKNKVALKSPLTIVPTRKYLRDTSWWYVLKDSELLLFFLSPPPPLLPKCGEKEERHALVGSHHVFSPQGYGEHSL